jgi:hypothetical protein
LSRLDQQAFKGKAPHTSKANQAKKAMVTYLKRFHGLKAAGT